MKTCDEQPIYEIEIQIYFYIKAIFGVSLLSWRICNWLKKKKSPKKHVAMSLNCICLFNCKTFIKFDRFQWNGWVEFQIVFFEFYFLIKLTFKNLQEKKKNILFDFDEFLTILTWNELKAAKPRHMSCDQSTANILWENFAQLIIVIIQIKPARNSDAIQFYRKFRYSIVFCCKRQSDTCVKKERYI